MIQYIACITFIFEMRDDEDKLIDDLEKQLMIEKPPLERSLFFI